MHTHAYAHTHTYASFWNPDDPHLTTSMYLKRQQVSPMSACTRSSIQLVVMMLIMFTLFPGSGRSSYLSAWLKSSVIYHTQFNHFIFDITEIIDVKSDKCCSSQWCRSGHQNMCQSFPHLLICLFYCSLSDTLQVHLGFEVLSWLSSDKMQYCKIAVLFLYLVIRAGHVTIYLTAKNLLRASL